MFPSNFARRIGYSFLALLLFQFTSLAQQGNDWVGIPVTLGNGVTVSVEELQRLSAEYDKNPIPKKLREELEFHRAARPNPHALPGSTWPPLDKLIQPSGIDNTGRVNATQTIFSNFLGANLTADGTVFPPDSNGDVGPGQLVIATNGRLKVYNKNNVCTGQQTTTTGSSSTNLASPVMNVDLNTFFSPATGGVGVSDPHVRYDRLSQRWFIVAIDLRAAPNRCVIAVSSGPTIVSSASFTFFFFVFDILPPVPPAFIAGFFDYPTLGVDANALYIGGRMFNTALTAYVGASVFVIRKSSILGAGPMVVTGFNGIGTASTGIYTPQGVHNDDPAAITGFIIGVNSAVFSQLDIHRISTPGGTPTASALIPLTVPTTSTPLNPVASGSAVTFDANDDRLFAAMIMKNTQTGVSSLWTSHAIAVTTAGTGATTGAGRRNGVRWYQIGNLAATPSLTQSGTVFDNAATTPRFYWFPGIATSGQGHSVIGASTCATNQFVDVAVAGRYSTDLLGTSQAPVLATASTTTYAPPADPGPGRRWGDYSQTVVDPSNNMTMWTFQTYTNNTNSWGVRVVQLVAPPPATPTSPGTIGCGSNVASNRVTNVTIAGTSVNNSGFYDPGPDAGGPGFASRLAVSSTGGAIASNIVFTSPTSISFTLTWPAVLAGTTQTFTITNPDCQSVTTTYTLPTGCINLPVRWLSFTGRDIGRRVQLNWVTDYEPDNSRFEIERQNTRGEWVPIGSQNSKGVNGGAYTEFDNNPLPVNFYRLKQVDADGKFTYSTIVKVEIKSNGAFVVYPNPAKDQLNVEFPESYRKGFVRLVNTLGEVVYTGRISSDNKQTIDISNLSSGNYVVEIESSAGGKQQSIVLIQRKEPKP